MCLSLLGSVFCVALRATTARIREEIGARDTLPKLASRAPAVFVAEAFLQHGRTRQRAQGATCTIGYAPTRTPMHHKGLKTRSLLLSVYSTHNLHACSALKRAAAPCRRNQPAARLHPDRGGHQKRIIEAARTGRSASAVEPDQPALLKPPAEHELVSVVWRAVRRAVADLGVVQLRQLQSKRRQVGI